MRRVLLITVLTSLLGVAAPAAACSLIAMPTPAELLMVTRSGEPQVMLLEGVAERNVHPVVTIYQTTAISEGPFGSLLVLTRYWGDQPNHELTRLDRDDPPEDTCGSQAPSRGTTATRALTADGTTWSFSTASADMAGFEALLGAPVDVEPTFGQEIYAAWRSWGPVWVLVSASAVGLVAIWLAVRRRRSRWGAVHLDGSG